MYLYNVYGYEGGYTLTHNNEFSKEEFKKMCKEAPMGDLYGEPYYDDSLITKYLIEKHGFKKAEYTAGFFVDADVD